VKFILMNSFSTSDDTKAFLNKSHADLVKVREGGGLSGGCVWGGVFRGRGCTPMLAQSITSATAMLSWSRWQRGLSLGGLGVEGAHCRHKAQPQLQPC
jgi:hypothetical protein